MANASLFATQTLFTSLSNALNTGAVGGGGSSSGGSTEAFRNLVINGNMIVDQRLEGRSNIISANGDYAVADRFFFRAVNTSNPNYIIQRVELSHTDNSITGHNFAIRAQAINNVAFSNTAFVGFYHNIEGAIATPLQWGTSNGRSATLSFYIKTNVTGTHWITLRNEAATVSYVATCAVSSADTYTRVTNTISAPPANTVWETGNKTGIWLRFDPVQVSAQTTTNNAWVSGNFNVPVGDFASNVWSVANNYVEITGVQLEVGNTATSFEYRPFSLERTLCQRYFEKSFPEGISPSPIYTARRLWFADGNTFFPSYTVGKSNDYNTLYAKYGQNTWMYFYVPSVNVYARLYWNNVTSSIVRQTWYSSSTDGVNWSAETSASNIRIPYSGAATVPCDFYEIERVVSPQSAPGNAVYMMGSNSINQIPFCTTKRSIPTMTFYNPYSSNGNVATDTTFSSNLAVFTPNINRFGVTSTDSTLWNCNVYFNWTANSDYY